jgi:predicted GIY-YIG superfamily endonuclease
MLPPPNVTGSLHMGHAFQHTIMDVLTRYQMDKTLLLYYVAMKISDKKLWLVYLLRCANNSLYCGVTNDLDKRLRQHPEQIEAKYRSLWEDKNLFSSNSNATSKNAYCIMENIRQKTVVCVFTKVC